MANDFYVVLAHDQTAGAPFKAQIVIPPDDLSNFVEPPERNEQGVFQLVIRQPIDDARHTALGLFMDAWSKVEMAVGDLLEGMLGTDHNNTPVLMNNLQARGQRDVLAVIGASMFDDASTAELNALLHRLKTQTDRRNYIVHGYWLLEILMRNHGGRPALVYQQYRAYSPSDPGERNKLRDRANTKERKKYFFSVARIKGITGEMGRLWHDLTSFTQRHFGPAKPVDQ